MRYPIRCISDQVRRYGWFFITTIMLGITAVFLPWLYHNTIEIVQAGTGTEGDPYTVCASGCDQTTIQAAINNAGAGAFISVQATYNPAGEGNINFNVADGMTIDCNSSGAVVGVDAGQKVMNLVTDNITIKNCTINNVYINDNGNSLLGFVLQNNTFASSSASSWISFSTAGTTNPSITGNTGDFRIDFQNITGGSITNNTFQNYVLDPSNETIEVEGTGYTISGNTFSMYTGSDNTMIGNYPAHGGIENSTITNNTLQYVSTVTSQNQGGLKAIQISHATSTRITGNYILLPVIEGSIGIDGIYLGEFGGNTVFSDVTVSTNTIKLMSDGDAIEFGNTGGTPDIDVTYNLLYSGTTQTGTGFKCANTITTSSLTFDYNGFYNLTNNITPYSPCISSIGANSKTTNPYLKTDDADASNDLQLAPFSDYLDVTLTTDIGAYNTVARGNSFTIDPSGTINYSSVHATTTGILSTARDNDTFTLAAGTYNPLSLSSLSGFTLDGAGATTIINGGTASSSLLLTNVSNSTFQDFVVQNASSTTASYTATQMIFDYGNDTYGDTSIFGAPGDNYTSMFASADGCAIDVQWNADGYGVSSYVSDDWNLWLVSALGAKLTVLVPDQFYSSAAAVEAACAEITPVTDVWIDDVFQYSNGVMTYNSSAVAAANVTLTSGMTNPPAVTRVLSGYAGIKFAGTSSNNTVSNVTSTANGYGIWFSGTSATNNVNDSFSTNAVIYDLYSDTSGTNNVKNTSFTSASSSITGTGEVNVYHKVRAYITNDVATELGGVGVTFTDGSGGSQTQTVTSTSGGYTPYTDYLLAWAMTSSSLATNNNNYNPFTVAALATSTYAASSTSFTLDIPNETVTLAMSEEPTAPTAPSSIATTTIAATNITLTWTDNSDDETGFIVQKSTNGSDYTTVSTTAVNVTSGSVTGLTPNTAYYFRVAATNSSGTSSYSTVGAQYTSSTIPTTVSATAGSATSLSVTWSEDTNPSGTVYQISGTGIATATTTATSTAITGLTPNTNYTINVKAQHYDSTFTSAASDSAYTNAAVPTTVSASAASATSIAVTWNANSNPNGTVFQVSGVGFSAVTTTATSYTITGLTPNTSYTFSVKAQHNDETFTSAATDSEYTNAAVPASATASANGQTSLIVSWSANSNVSGTKYELYNVTGSSVVTSTVTATSYTVTGLIANTSYQFKVRAQYLSDNSTWSSYSINSTAVATAAVSDSVSMMLSVGESSTLQFTDNVVHTITANSVNVGANTANLTIESTPVTQDFTLNTADTIDTDGNGADDMTVTVTDVSANSATITFASYTPPSDGGDDTPSPSGGSSIAPSVPASPTVSAPTMQDVVVSQGTPLIVSVGNSSHTITVTSITSDGVITLIIQSEPITITLKPGEEKLVDSDGDGSYDLFVKYNSVMAARASLTLSSVEDLEFSINKALSTTNSRNVTLYSNSHQSVMMAISNEPTFTGVSYESYTQTKSWMLTEGSGVKTVYVKFRTAQGGTKIIADTITLVGQTTTNSDQGTGNNDKSGFTSVTPDKLSANIFTEILKLGSKGTQVVKLQEKLKELKHYTYQYITGYFGPITEKALKLFQKDNTITQTGMTDEQTREKLNNTQALEHLSTQAPESTKVTPVKSLTAYTFTKFLNYGMRGEEIKQLQVRLQELNYLSKDIKPNGVFGPATRAAVIKLQQEHNLKPVAGYVGPGTRAVLNQ